MTSDADQFDHLVLGPEAVRPVDDDLALIGQPGDLGVGTTGFEQGALQVTVACGARGWSGYDEGSECREEPIAPAARRVAGHRRAYFAFCSEVTVI